jgi:hypothetical protein
LRQESDPVGKRLLEASRLTADERLKNIDSLCESTDSHGSVYFKRESFMVCELYLIKKTKQNKKTLNLVITLTRTCCSHSGVSSAVCVYFFGGQN